MGKILQLDTITANSIAAGEVVERPASVVKELCENAMDAGATQITVEIYGGGIRSIQVSDNGSGMDAEDALNAFTAHATSKLRHITDLEEIGSMGFRGEALPSIASVSKVTLKTRLIGEPIGTQVRIVGGELEEHRPVGTAEGSTILVEQLFFNVPARHKFLKKDSTEAARVTEVVNRLVLARPDISFLLKKDGQVILHSPGNSDLDAAVYTVFGRDVAQSTLPITQVDLANPVRVRGVVGRPSIARRSRSQQLIFVNGRAVQSPMINKAIDEAYKGLLMKGEFAFALVLLEIPQSLVDVNVHPQKLEVRFWNESQVFSAVNHAIKDSLYQNLAIRSEETDTVQPEPASAAEVYVSKQEQEQATITPPVQEAKIELPSIFDIADTYKAEVSPPLSDENQAVQVREVGRERVETAPSVDNDNVDANRAYAASKQDSLHAGQPTERDAELLVDSPADESNSEIELSTQKSGTEKRIHEDLLPLLEARIAGVLFRTYIILEHADSYTLIDQHAAHERILFEHFLAQAQAGEIAASQDLLAPEVMHLSVEEIDILERESQFFNDLGFRYDRFGERQIALRGVPHHSVGQYAAETLREALDEILDSGENFGLKSNRERVYLAIATAACKAAIKAHDKITDMEIRQMIQDLLTLENPYQCPHGRPVFIRSSQKELEKRFRRIV